MSRQTDKLSATAVRNAKPRDKIFKMADGGGLYLEVLPTGSKYWHLKYRFAGKEKHLAIGVYGTNEDKVSLVAARAARDEAKRQLAEGIDPSSTKRIAKQLGEQAASSEDARADQACALMDLYSQRDDRSVKERVALITICR